MRRIISIAAGLCIAAGTTAAGDTAGYYDDNMAFRPYSKAHPAPPPPAPQPAPPVETGPRLEHYKPVAISPPPPLPDEAQFVEINRRFRDAYKAADNDLARGAARPNRGRKLCQMFESGFEVEDWTGTVETLSSNGDGKGVLSISLGDEISVKTWNNALSDVGSDTLLEPRSLIHLTAMTLRKGQTVHFSGSFIHRATVDCIVEASMTLYGSMTRPEFIFKFSEIR